MSTAEKIIEVLSSSPDMTAKLAKLKKELWGHAMDHLCDDMDREGAEMNIRKDKQGILYEFLLFNREKGDDGFLDTIVRLNFDRLMKEAIDEVYQSEGSDEQETPETAPVEAGS